MTLSAYYFRIGCTSNVTLIWKVGGFSRDSWKNLSGVNRYKSVETAVLKSQK